MGRICGLEIHAITSEFFEENGYICHLPNAAQALVIDPGKDSQEFISYLHSNHLDLKAILLTHSHLDHIAGVRDVKKEFPRASIITGIHEGPLLTDARANLSFFLGFPMTTPPADILVQDEERLELAGVCMRVVEIPGHSPGHVAFILETTPPIIFGGDILFQGSIGRCDFPNGNFEQLISGIQGKFYPLDNATRIFPGHGPSTTLGEEKQNNPFLQNLSIVPPQES
ncbi:MAG: MBL fold metallo-hydrolase [Gemmataceae bacterium]|nr:MBL fold metallo-hydrolase [Gemmataceae bacterium]